MDKEFLVLITFDRMPNFVLSAEEDNVNLIVLYRLFCDSFTSFGKISAKVRKIYEYIVWPEKSLSFFNYYDFFCIHKGH